MNNKPITVKSWKHVTDFIWASCRYFIGRKTIAASAHPSDIVELIKANPDMMTDVEKVLLANDIRNEIAERIRFCSNVSIVGAVENYDPITEIMRLLSKVDSVVDFKNEVYFKSHIFEINYRSKTSSISEMDCMQMSTLLTLTEIYIYIPWIKLAEWLDPHTEITASDGKAYESICFPEIVHEESGDRPVIRYVDVNTYVKNPCATVYFTPGKIQNIKKY